MELPWEELQRWAELWEDEELAEVRFELSGRMTSSLGRCYPRKRLIRLNPRLFSDLGHLLSEVLCHELAHELVYRRHGKARPHGEQWRRLVEQAGYPPRTGIPVAGFQRSSTTYVHRCPECGMTRKAGRRVRQWRCASCVEKGLEGKLKSLTIQPLNSSKDLGSRPLLDLSTSCFPILLAVISLQVL